MTWVLVCGGGGGWRLSAALPPRGDRDAREAAHMMGGGDAAAEGQRGRYTEKKAGRRRRHSAACVSAECMSGRQSQCYSLTLFAVHSVAVHATHVAGCWCLWRSLWRGRHCGLFTFLETDAASLGNGCSPCDCCGCVSELDCSRITCCRGRLCYGESWGCEHSTLMAVLPSSLWQTLGGCQLSPFPYGLQVLPAVNSPASAATAIYCGLYPLIFR